MNAVTVLDREAVVRVCERYKVAQLRIFGSSVTGRFDPGRSDVDFFVDFLPEVDDLLGDCLALKEELERIVGRRVDLVMSDVVENPYFAAEASRSAQEVYAA